MLPDRLSELFAFTEREVGGDAVWLLSYRWYRHPFALVDWNGVGHDDAGCRRIHKNGETIDQLMARDPWPCKACVQTPAPDALHGTFRPVGGTAAPNGPTGSQGQPGGPQGPKQRMAAVFGTV